MKQVVKLIYFGLILCFAPTITSCISSTEGTKAVPKQDVSIYVVVRNVLKNERIVQQSIATPTEKEVCTAAGGKITTNISLSGIKSEICGRSYSDANKSCNDSSECEGLCNYYSCTSESNLTGCLGITVKGEVGQICID